MNNGDNNGAVRFPLWKTVDRLNDPHKEKGFVFTQRIINDIDVRIECRNGSASGLSAPNTIYIALCNSRGFPISSKSFMYCERGYYAAIMQTIKWAESIQSAFNTFLEDSDISI